jgi:hypothetical protein
MWCVAELSPEYIEKMEDVLAVYEKPYNSAEPVICMDEKPVTLHAEVRAPIPMAPGKIAKRDNEYERRGTANVFCAVEPKAGRHFTLPTPNRSAPEFAQALGVIVDNYPFARTIHLVMDNLNIHCRKTLTAYFGQQEGGYLWDPPHGSLHSDARKLAEPGRDRDQFVRPTMPGTPKNPKFGRPGTGVASLEPPDQPEPCQNQLAVHPQERACQVPLQE